MMKVLAVTLLATAAMIGAAQASATDDYQACWTEAATTSIDQNGVSENSLKWAIAKADVRCYDQRQAAGAEAGEMRAYMEVQLYRANPVDEDAPKIEKVSGHQASSGWALYNARTGYLCSLPLDSEPMRQLVSTNRLELARQKTGCVIVEQTIEVEKVRTWGDTIEVRYVNAKGEMVEAYTSARTFRTKAGWNSIGIE
jgi:hypothetical protein